MRPSSKERERALVDAQGVAKGLVGCVEIDAGGKLAAVLPAVAVESATGGRVLLSTVFQQNLESAPMAEPHFGQSVGGGRGSRNCYSGRPCWAPIFRTRQEVKSPMVKSSIIPSRR